PPTCPPRPEQQAATGLGMPSDDQAPDNVTTPVRELEAQDNQSGDHSIGENQLMVWTAALGTQTLVTSPFTQPGILPRHPWSSQLRDDLAELIP
ncbi:hypothetical protein ACIRU3_47585, partial [Streptomyces sp. NPDC101151]|uniref:hypothetical protein n=1 Tax=Streptomyces sp. NPDC101151 TaxID=3366115 RepID=UPI0038255716